MTNITAVRAELWYEGHWGFQYYMNELGASAMDFKNSPIKPGDLVVVPSDNTNILPPNPQKSTLLEIFTIPGAQWLATFNPDVGGGFTPQPSHRCRSPLARCHRKKFRFTL